MSELIGHGPDPGTGPGTEGNKEPTLNNKDQEKNQPHESYVDENGVPILIIEGYQIPIG